VWQTYPRWRFVHSERHDGFNGRDSIRLYWTFDLGAPYCGSTNWSRRYKAVVRLFSPFTDRVVATDKMTFGLRCT
jgi:hypothetical protein